MAATSRSERSPTFPELLVELGHDLSALVHDEIALVKKETQSELRRTCFVLGGTGVLAIAAVLTCCAAAVLALARVLDPAFAALVVSAAVAATTVAFGIAARRWRQPMDLRPELTNHASEKAAS